LHRDEDKNIKCKAYFAELGQFERAYFTINEISNKPVFIIKNMVPMLYKHVSVYIKYYITYTLYKAHIHRRSQGGGKEPWPLQFFRISRHFVL